MDIKITKTNEPKALPNEKDLGFGKYFTDHMLIVEHDESGWKNARIVPFGNLSLSPASTVFHYGAEIFEGMKVYFGADKKLRMFRPRENMKRMNDSAERLALPAFDGEEFLSAIKKLISIDKRFVPKAEGTSLYIRPFLFGNEPHLGVHAVKEAMFVTILSPVGSYYEGGLKPVKIAIESEDVRAVRGGTGYAKCGGNYGASLRAGKRAAKKGFSQVLWLDGVERKYVEEVGSMNVFFKIDGKIITPALTGSVLPGITRKSCIELLKSEGCVVEERLLAVDELISAAKQGKVEEAFGTGTAAVVSPIGELSYKGEEYVIPTSEKTLARALYDELTGIQYGKIEDKFGWTEVLD